MSTPVFTDVGESSPQTAHKRMECPLFSGQFVEEGRIVSEAMFLTM